MIAYIDTSIVLRLILEQPDPLTEWEALDAGVMSPLLRLECMRTLDRYRLERKLTRFGESRKRADIETILSRLDLIQTDEVVLDIAEMPFSTPLGTLDAIHLATAIAYRAAQPDDERPLLFATHDVQLARAAKAMHFEVIGA